MVAGAVKYTPATCPRSRMNDNQRVITGAIPTPLERGAARAWFESSPRPSNALHDPSKSSRNAETLKFLQTPNRRSAHALFQCSSISAFQRFPPPNPARPAVDALPRAASAPTTHLLNRKLCDLGKLCVRNQTRSSSRKAAKTQRSPPLPSMRTSTPSIRVSSCAFVV